ETATVVEEDAGGTAGGVPEQLDRAGTGPDPRAGPGRGHPQRPPHLAVVDPMVLLDQHRGADGGAQTRLQGARRVAAQPLDRVPGGAAPAVARLERLDVGVVQCYAELSGRPVLDGHARRLADRVHVRGPELEARQCEPQERTRLAGL